MYDDALRGFTRAVDSAYTTDPDIGLRYADLPSLIAASSLDAGTRATLGGYLDLLRYEEAGRLHAALRGGYGQAGVGYALRLAVALRARDSVRRVQQAADRALTDSLAKARRAQMWRNVMSDGIRVVGWLALAAVILLPIAIALKFYTTKARAIRSGSKRVPLFGGFADIVLWDPGETVVILKNKLLQTIQDTVIVNGAPKSVGGIRTISAWRGEEYKGRLTSKTKLYAWQSEAIHTSDGVPVTFRLGIWWRIANPTDYVSRVSAEFHTEDAHERDALDSAAEVWLERFTAGTLREQVSKLRLETLISPDAWSVIRLEGSHDGGILTFAGQIEHTKDELNRKISHYGLSIERIEVQKLDPPQDIQETLEAVRRKTFEPLIADKEAAALKIRKGAESEIELAHLRGLADIIGKDGVRTKEILREVNLGALANPLVQMAPIVMPISDAVRDAVTRGLAPPSAAPSTDGAKKQLAAQTPKAADAALPNSDAQPAEGDAGSQSS